MAVTQLGLGIVSAGAGYQAQQQQYKSQRVYARQNAANAATAAYSQYDNLNRRAVQDGIAASQQKQATSLEASRATATAEVAASEAGISGLSVDHLIRDIAGQAGRSSAALDTNQQFNRAYLQGEKEAARAGGQNQINSVPVPEKPSILPTVVNIFGSGLNAYSGYKQSKARGY